MSFKPPDNFDFTHPESWPAWRKRYERFSMASELNKKSFVIQLNSLIYTMGSTAEQIYGVFNFEESDTATIKQVLDRFDGHFTPQNNIIHVRSKFYQRSQAASESIEAFHRSLYELSAYADFPDREEAIRDRFVLGVNSLELSEKLQLEPNLTLDSAVKLARQFETVKQQVGEQRTESVQAVGARGFGRGRSRGRGDRYKSRGGSASAGARASKGASSTQSKSGRSDRCGGSPHRRENCPAKGRDCRSCGKIGHYQSVCRSRNSQHVKFVNADSDSGEEFFISAVRSKTFHDKAWMTDVKIGNTG